MWHLPLLLAFLPICRAAPVTISNVIPRRDTSGAVLDAHDSKLNYFNHLYYWHAASYGNCSEPKGENGCAAVGVGNCGFQTDHNVTLYTSLDLATWTNAGHAFTATGNLPPNSVLFAPKTVYNARTSTWVMFYNYIVETFSNSFYGIATSAAPEGPFSVVNPNLQLQFTDNGDEGIPNRPPLPSRLRHFWLLLLLLRQWLGGSRLHELLPPRPLHKTK